MANFLDLQINLSLFYFSFRYLCITKNQHIMHKSILCAIAIGAILVAESCTKEQRQPKSDVRTLTYAMSGNSMYYTKAVQAEDVLQAINATLPTEMNLVLTSTTTSKVTTAVTGQGVVLPSDTYRVLGAWSGARASSDIVRGTSAYLTSAPAIDVEQELTIIDDVSEYQVNGQYSCFCLVCEADMVEKAVVTTYSGTQEEINFITSGNSKLIFAKGDYSSVYLTITLTPVDKEKYSETTYNISTTKHNNIGYAEFGKWYLLEPTASGVQPKLIGLDLPNFSQGTL